METFGRLQKKSDQHKHENIYITNKTDKNSALSSGTNSIVGFALKLMLTKWRFMPE